MKSLIKKIKRSPVIPIVRLDGVIGSVGQFGTSGLDDYGLKQVLEKAFAVSRAKAVALVINSPGGSPAQSSLIAGRISRLAKDNKLQVFAFCEDVAASGGYWLACAADEIFADENSIIGSIGVISASFGFDQFIARQGIERRIFTSGEEKSTLDPFLPSDPEDIQRLKRIQKSIHSNFINHVERSRGEKIGTNKIFNGEFWDAGKALELGLIDGIGHLEPILKSKFGNDIEFKFLSRKKSFFSRFSRSAANAFFEGIMNKSFFSRFGL